MPTNIIGGKTSRIVRARSHCGVSSAPDVVCVCAWCVCCQVIVVSCVCTVTPAAAPGPADVELVSDAAASGIADRVRGSRLHESMYFVVL